MDRRLRVRDWPDIVEPRVSCSARAFSPTPSTHTSLTSSTSPHRRDAAPPRTPARTQLKHFRDFGPSIGLLQQPSEPSRACPSFQPIFREGKDEGAAHVVFMPPARARARARTTFYQHRPVLDASLKIILGGPEADRPAMHRRHLHLGWLRVWHVHGNEERQTWDGMG